MTKANQQNTPNWDCCEMWWNQIRMQHIKYTSAKIQMYTPWSRFWAVTSRWAAEHSSDQQLHGDRRSTRVPRLPWIWSLPLQMAIQLVILVILVPFWRERNQTKSMWGVQTYRLIDLIEGWLFRLGPHSSHFKLKAHRAELSWWRDWTSLLERMAHSENRGATNSKHMIHCHCYIFALQAIYVLLVWTYLDDLDAWGYVMVSYGCCWSPSQRFPQVQRGKTTAGDFQQLPSGKPRVKLHSCQSCQAAKCQDLSRGNQGQHVQRV